MHRLYGLGLKLGLAAFTVWATGCVPLNDYRALERRFTEQEQYVVAHKDKVREQERREQVLTLRAREQERQLELTRARLKKSETLRRRLAARVRSMRALPASTPKETPMNAKVLGLEVNPITKGLVLENGVFFAPGRSMLKSQGQRILRRVVQELNTSRFRGTKIRIEGHTDDMPIKRSGHKSNWSLSSKRALAVLHYLEKSGIASKRLAFAGYGPYKPMKPGKSKRARAKNRRVEIVLFD